MNFFLFLCILFILTGCNNIFNDNNYSNSGINIKDNKDNVEINVINKDFNKEDFIIGTKVIKEDFVYYNNNLDDEILNNNKLKKDEFNNNVDNTEVEADIQKTKQLTQSASELITLIKNDVFTDIIDVVYDNDKNILNITLKNNFKEVANDIIEMYFVLKSNEIKDIEIDNGFKKELFSSGIIKVYKIDSKPIFNTQYLANIKIYSDKSLKNLEIINITYVIKKGDDIIRKQNKNIVVK